jgi:dTDP-4-dehydrorhamnose 3,5-epimerase
MEIIENVLNGILLIKPKVFEDERGYFFESYNEKNYFDIGIKEKFCQDNQSLSQKGVLRGLHFQEEPFAQGKLVRCISGSVLDVAVDIRKNSPTFGQHYKCLISDQNKLTMWIPKGFAHGFLTLEDNTIFSYKCTDYYNKSAERNINWNDPLIGIDWEIENPILSEKDLNGYSFEYYETLI